MNHAWAIVHSYVKLLEGKPFQKTQQKFSRLSWDMDQFQPLPAHIAGPHWHPVEVTHIGWWCYLG